jgi:hypothetical protein
MIQLDIRGIFLGERSSSVYGGDGARSAKCLKQLRLLQPKQQPAFIRRMTGHPLKSMISFN